MTDLSDDKDTPPEDAPVNLSSMMQERPTWRSLDDVAAERRRAQVAISGRAISWVVGVMIAVVFGLVASLLAFSELGCVAGPVILIAGAVTMALDLRAQRARLGELRQEEEFIRERIDEAQQKQLVGGLSQASDQPDSAGALSLAERQRGELSAASSPEDE